MRNLKELESHFEFGKNWASFSKLIDPPKIRQAVDSMTRLFGADGLRDKTFLDIGCGSGLFSLAATRLGAKSIVALDIDPDSVATTMATLKRFSANPNWKCSQASVFDLDSKTQGTFDVVYSWGVLHHTGDMYAAIKNAAGLVNESGLLALGLYRKTKLCEAWKVEKRIYSRAPEWIRWPVRNIFKAMMVLNILRVGKNPFKLLGKYAGERGMDWGHDVEDWLGGYPYESISLDEMKVFAPKIGFEIIREFGEPGSHGFFGSTNDEYVLRRKALY